LAGLSLLNVGRTPSVWGVTLACVVSRSSLYERIRARQYDHPYLLALKDTMQNGDAKDVSIKDDGVLRM